MGRRVYSSRSIEGPAEGNTAPIPSVATERPASAEPPRTERRISLQDYAFTFMLADAATLVGTGMLLNHLFLPKAQSSMAWASPSILIISLFYLLASIAFKSYSSSIVLKLRETIRRLFSALGVTFGFFLIPVDLYSIASDYSRPRFFFWALISSLIIVFIRVVAQAHLRRSLERGAFVNKCLSVGMFCCPLLVSELAQVTQEITRVVQGPRLDDLRELMALSDEIASAEIDQVQILTPWQRAPVVMKNVNLLRHLSAEVIVLAYDPQVVQNLAGDDAARGGSQGCYISLRAVEPPITGWNLWLKRKEDIVIAALVLFLISPILLLVALLIRLDSKGPVFFRQRRVGFNGSIFEILKFRTMYVDQTDHDAVRQTGRGDARVTRVGRVLRRTSLDELPQFINVLQGSMSIVGPRPHALQTRTEGKSLDELVEHYAARHRVKPGITGLAQVNGLRGELDSAEKLRRRVDYDIEYIDRWSIWLDIEILLKTVPLVFYDKYAY